MSPNPAVLTWPRPVETGAPWDPTELSLVAWWDPSDTSTITESGGSVSELQDLSGNGNHLTQATSTRRPTTGSVTRNGLNVLSYDGGDDLARVAGAFSTQAQPFTIAAVFRDVPGSARWYASNSSAVQYGSSLGIYANSTFRNGPAYTANTWAYCTHVYNGSSSVVRLNGSGGTVASPGTAGLQADFFIGSRTGSFFLTGQVAEFIIAAGAVSGSDLTSLESYLASKWGF